VDKKMKYFKVKKRMNEYEEEEKEKREK